MSTGNVKQYLPSEWEKLLEHAFLTDEWIQPQNQDAYMKQLLLVFYPLTAGKTEALAEQCAATLCVSGYEVAEAKLKHPSEAMWKEKLGQAKLALRDFLGESAGLSRGVLRKDKRIAHRDAFKWAYQSSDFGDPAYCSNCHSYSDFSWNNRRGDWTVKCDQCGWKKVFRKSWIDKQYRQSKQEADRENAKVRPYASKEDDYYFYMKLKALYVPIDPHNGPTQVVVN